MSSILCGSLPISSCATCSFKYAATASSRPFRVASPMPVTPSSVVIRKVTKLRDGLVTNTSAAMIFMNFSCSFRESGGQVWRSRKTFGRCPC
ncbi:hypothetical protein D9M72_575490 [compost metagenome]